MRILLIVGTIVALAMGLAQRAEAGRFIEFESGGPGADRVRLIGYLARPPGNGPFPAVVVLHGCGGFHQGMLAWADRLQRWGYVAFAVDSFGHRGIERHCTGFRLQPIDAFQALAYLKALPFVRADHVAVLGSSMGGGSVLAAVERGFLADLFPDKFRAGVALYPPCSGATGIMTVPTLVLIGALDDWTRASACEAMVAGHSDIGVARTPGDRSLVQLVVYPDAHHSFDQAELRFIPGGVQADGHRLEYNDAATRDSIEKIRAFLQETLGRQ